ncbi:MAG: hypothetical protein U5R31_05070 [Acidimicrobiia bacterium]|nr:hypothetical protein [Acidimicrobiia bacterium]
MLVLVGTGLGTLIPDAGTSDLEAENAGLERRLDEARDEIDDIRDDRSANEDTVEELAAQNRELTGRVDELEAQLGQTREERDAAAAQRDQLAGRASRRPRRPWPRPARSSRRSPTTTATAGTGAATTAATPRPPPPRPATTTAAAAAAAAAEPDRATPGPPNRPGARRSADGLGDDRRDPQPGDHQPGERWV